METVTIARSPLGHNGELGENVKFFLGVARPTCAKFYNPLQEDTDSWDIRLGFDAANTLVLIEVEQMDLVPTLPVNFEINVTFDRKADAAYISFKDIACGEVAHTEQCDPEVVPWMINIDYDDAQTMLGIEVLNASKNLPADVLAEVAAITAVTRKKKKKLKSGGGEGW